MNSALFARPNPVIPAQPSADQSGKEGYGVGLSTGSATTTPDIPVATLSASTTVPIDGIILDGNTTATTSAIGVLGCMPPVRVKLSGTVANGDRLQQAADGTFVTDAGSGNARCVCGIALEDGVSGDLIVAQMFAPHILA